MVAEQIVLVVIAPRTDVMRVQGRVGQLEELPAQVLARVLGTAGSPGGQALVSRSACAIDGTLASILRLWKRTERRGRLGASWVKPADGGGAVRVVDASLHREQAHRTLDLVA